MLARFLLRTAFRREFDSRRGCVKEFHFAVWKHSDGILMISVDSLIGFLRSSEIEEGHTFENLAEMLEGMIERVE